MILSACAVTVINLWKVNTQTPLRCAYNMVLKRACGTERQVEESRAWAAHGTACGLRLTSLA